MTAVLVPGEMTPGLLAGALLQAQLSPMGSGPNVISPSKCPEKLGGLFLFFKCKSSCFFFFFAMSLGLWDLSFPNRIEPGAPAVEVQSLNQWTTREVQKLLVFKCWQ